MTEQEFERALGRPLMAREQFVAAVRAAVTDGRPYATGKLGVSERALLHYPLFLSDESHPGRRRAYELSLTYKALPQSGIFPADPGFYREWAEVLAARLRRLDCVGLFPDAYPLQLELLRRHAVEGEVVVYLDQEPDRSAKADDARCWLPALRDRKLLLVSPFAGLLRSRADRPTFEAVWEKTGKRWFEPHSVEAIEFPYGFEPATQARYPTALDLLDDITSEIARRDFDVAVIGAGGLGIPIAAFVKELGKVGFSLGGHLQVLFGVLGERWAHDPDWQRDYFNEAWVPMPDEYRPDPVHTGEHYW